MQAGMGMRSLRGLPRIVLCPLETSFDITAIRGLLRLGMDERGDAARAFFAAAIMLLDGDETKCQADYCREFSITRSAMSRAVRRLAERQSGRQKIQCLSAQYAGTASTYATTQRIKASTQKPPGVS